MKSLNQQIGKKPWIGWVLFLITMGVVFLLGLLASSIIERRAEGIFAYSPKVKLTDYEPLGRKLS